MKKFVLFPFAAIMFAACSESPTGFNDAPQFHLDEGTNSNNHHEDLKPTLTSATIALEGQELAENGNVVISWTAATGAVTTVTRRTYYRYALDCTGSGCTPVEETDVELTTTSFTAASLGPGVYMAKVRGLGGPNANSTNHGSVWVVVSFSVGTPTPSSVDQTVTFGTAPAATYGYPHIDISTWASASSPITYSSESPAVCTVEGAEVHIVSAGTCIVKATAEANAFFDAATETSSFVIHKAELAINADNATTDYGIAPILTYTLSGFVYSESADALRSDGRLGGEAACAVAAGTSANAGFYEDAISCAQGTLTATNYTFQSGAAANLTINRIAPTINITSALASADLGSKYTPVVVTNSDGAVSVESLTPSVCSVLDGEVSFEAIGSCRIRANVTQGTNWNAGSSAEQEIAVLYKFSGFFRPVEMFDADNNLVLNRVKAGSSVPLKFSLDGFQGMAVFKGTPKVGVVACDVSAEASNVQDTGTPGSSGLTYDATSGQYVYVWKTEKNWTGCRQIVVEFADGQVQRANFRFLK